MLEKIKKYYQLKKFNKAGILARKGLKTSPNNLEYYYLLGLINYSLGKYSISMKYLNHVLKYNPKQVDVLVAKTHCLRAMNKNHEAIKTLEGLLSLDSRKSDIFLFLGDCYLKIADINKGNHFLRESLKNDNSKQNLMNIYKIYSNCDKRKEAAKLLKESIFFNTDDDVKLKYCNDQINYNLGLFDEVFKILDSFEKKNFINPQIFYLLGMSSLILGHTERSKEYFLKSVSCSIANKDIFTFTPFIASSYFQLSRMNYNFKEKSIIQIEDLFSRKIDAISQSLLGLSLSKIYGKKKNFLESTKYLKKSNKIAYKRIVIPKGWKFDDEIIFFQNLKKLYLYLKRLKNLSKINLNPIFILGMPRSGTTLVENILTQSNEVEATGENQFLLKEIFRFIPNINKEIIQNWNLFSKINSDYIQDYQDYLKIDKTYFTDKTPHNFLLLGIIKLLIPNSKIIFCKRNKNDNILSIYENFFPSASHEYSYDFDCLKKYFELHIELMKFWESENISFFKLNYEDLITNSQKVIKELCVYTNLKFSENMLNPHLNKRKVVTASFYQVRQPINNKSINRWQNYRHLFNNNS